MQIPCTDNIQDLLLTVTVCSSSRQNPGFHAKLIDCLLSIIYNRKDDSYRPQQSPTSILPRQPQSAGKRTLCSVFPSRNLDRYLVESSIFPLLLSLGSQTDEKAVRTYAFDHVRKACTSSRMHRQEYRHCPVPHGRLFLP